MIEVSSTKTGCISIGSLRTGTGTWPVHRVQSMSGISLFVSWLCFLSVGLISQASFLPGAGVLAYIAMMANPEKVLSQSGLTLLDSNAHVLIQSLVSLCRPILCVPFFRQKQRGPNHMDWQREGSLLKEQSTKRKNAEPAPHPAERDLLCIRKSKYVLFTWIEVFTDENLNKSKNPIKRGWL